MPNLFLTHVNQRISLLASVTTPCGHCERPKGAWQSPFFNIFEIASVVLLPRNDIKAPVLFKMYKVNNHEKNTTHHHSSNRPARTL